MDTVYGLVPCISFETEKRDGLREAVIGGPQQSLYTYSISQLLDAEESLPMSSDTEGEEGDVYFAPIYVHCS